NDPTIRSTSATAPPARTGSEQPPDEQVAPRYVSATYLHLRHEPDDEPVDVHNVMIGEFAASFVSNHLVDGDGNPAVGLDGECGRHNRRFDLIPLPTPIGTQLVVAMDHTSLPPVRPRHVRPHGRQQLWYVTVVERRVETGESVLQDGELWRV